MTADHIIEKIREALEARPTPGPWQVITDQHEWHLPARGKFGEEKTGLHTERRIATVRINPQAKDFDPVVTMTTGVGAKDMPPRSMIWLKEEDAAYIAACNPQNIAALLAERDALRKALAPFAERCKEAVREDDSDNDGVTVKTIHLRRARTLAGDNHE